MTLKARYEIAALSYVMHGDENGAASVSNRCSAWGIVNAVPHPRSMASFTRAGIRADESAASPSRASVFAQWMYLHGPLLDAHAARPALHRLRDAFTYRCGEQHSLARRYEPREARYFPFNCARRKRARAPECVRV